MKKVTSGEFAASIDTLTITLVIFKLVGVINWSWWVIFSPFIFGFFYYSALIADEKK